MEIYNHVYCASGITVSDDHPVEDITKFIQASHSSYEELALREIKYLGEFISHRGSKVYPDYRFQLIHKVKLVDGTLFKPEVSFEVVG